MASNVTRRKLSFKRFKVILEEHLRIFLESQATITGHEAVQESIQEKPFQTEKQSSPESKSTMQLPLPASTKPGRLSKSFSSPSSQEPKPGVNLSKSLNSKLTPEEVMMMASLADFNKGVYIKKDNDADDKKVSENAKEESKSEGELHDREEWVNGDTGEDNSKINDETPAKQDLLKPAGQTGEDNSKINDETPAKQDLLKPDGQTGEDNSKIIDEASAKQDLANPDQLSTPSSQSLEIRFQKLFNYSRKCVSLCWFMRGHSPELYLEDKAERDSKFDTGRFEQYTKTGDIVDYVVWPALFLHEGGPLLGKGVAQPK